MHKKLTKLYFKNLLRHSIFTDLNINYDTGVYTYEI